MQRNIALPERFLGGAVLGSIAIEKLAQPLTARRSLPEGIGIAQWVRLPRKRFTGAVTLCLDALLVVLPLRGIFQVTHRHTTADINELRRLALRTQVVDQGNCFAQC